MVPRINLLPLWLLPNTKPAFYDIESDTAIEMVGKVYNAMRELQTDYNKFVLETNQTIADFILGINTDQDEFEQKIVKLVHDYIIMLDSKIAHQDRKIDETIVYIKENLQTAITEVISEMKETGEFDEAVLNALNNIETRITNLENTKVTLTYNEEDKGLYFSNVGGEE